LSSNDSSLFFSSIRQFCGEKNDKLEKERSTIADISFFGGRHKIPNTKKKFLLLKKPPKKKKKKKK